MGKEATGITYCELGTDSTPPTLADTALKVPTDRKAVTRRWRTDDNVYTSTFFLNTECNIVMKEVGLYGGASAGAGLGTGRLFNRALVNFDNSAGEFDVTIETRHSLAQISLDVTKLVLTRTIQAGETLDVPMRLEDYQDNPQNLDNYNDFELFIYVGGIEDTYVSWGAIPGLVRVGDPADGIIALIPDVTTFSSPGLYYLRLFAYTNPSRTTWHTYPHTGHTLMKVV